MYDSDYIDGGVVSILYSYAHVKDPEFNTVSNYSFKSREEICGLLKTKARRSFHRLVDDRIEDAQHLYASLHNLPKKET